MFLYILSLSKNRIVDSGSENCSIISVFRVTRASCFLLLFFFFFFFFVLFCFVFLFVFLKLHPFCYEGYGLKFYLYQNLICCIIPQDSQPILQKKTSSYLHPCRRATCYVASMFPSAEFGSIIQARYSCI